MPMKTRAAPDRRSAAPMHRYPERTHAARCAGELGAGVRSVVSGRSSVQQDGHAGLTILLFFIGMAIFSFFADPARLDPTLTIDGPRLAGPSLSYPLGTDRQGISVLSLVIEGSRPRSRRPGRRAHLDAARNHRRYVGRLQGRASPTPS